MKTVKSIFTIGILFLLTVGLNAQGSELRKKHFLLKNGFALKGYDAVSYFTGLPIMGNLKFILVQNGIYYQFSSEANKKTFQANPSKYEPAYGGWCAYAMGNSGTKVDVDPKNFKITSGRLFLFYKDWLGNTRDDWNEDEVKLTKKADANWTKIFK